MAVLSVVAPLLAPARVEAQALFASHPRSGLVVGPLFVVATLASDAADVPVEVIFSLMIPRAAPTYEEVLRVCGSQMEVREDLALPRRRTLIHRGRRDVPHRQWAWSWLAAVSYWDVERHEVETVVDDGLVQNIHVRVERARSGR